MGTFAGVNWQKLSMLSMGNLPEKVVRATAAPEFSAHGLRPNGGYRVF
jgi:hypothetical protein